MKRFLGANFTSTLSIALVLFVLGLLTVGSLISAQLAKHWREQIELTITISERASADYGNRLVTRLNRSTYSASAVYISPDSALVIMTEELGDNPMDLLGVNPLPPTVSLQLKAEYAETDSINMIIDELMTTQKGLISDIDYNNSQLDTINKNLQRFAIGLSFLAFVLLIISISLINNTVCLTLHADRFLINTMRLVGATKWFVRWPYIRTHIVCGLVAAVLALCGIYMLIFAYANSIFVHSMGELFHPMAVLILVGTVLLLGILIPAMAAWYAADRYMGKSVDELYLM